MLRKVRINDLARELEVKSKLILDVLPKVGVVERKTHSSSIEEDEAGRVKKYILEHESSLIRGSRIHTSGSEEPRPKIDLSRISRPGDVLRAIVQGSRGPALSSKSVAAHVWPKPVLPVPGQPIYRRTITRPSKPKSSPGASAVQRRIVRPDTGPRPVYSAKPIPTRVKLETSAAAKLEQQTDHQNVIEQAEEALKLLRTQEKQTGRRHTLDS